MFANKASYQYIFLPSVIILALILLQELFFSFSLKLLALHCEICELSLIFYRKFISMDTNQPTNPLTPPPSTPVTTYAPVSAGPGMFGTKIPSSVAFFVGILLFLLPFAELKCSGTTFANKSGLDYAMGNNWKTVNGMMGKNDIQDAATSTDKMQKGNTQYLALAAAGLGVLGLLLAFSGAKGGGIGGLVTGALSAASLIGLMIDEKNNFSTSLKNQAINKVKEGSDSLGFDKIGGGMDNMKPIMAFTPWFYIAIVAFLAGAFFCYKRMSAPKV